MPTASDALDRVLVMEMVRVTEAAAVAASRLIGRGDEKAADAAAVEAMRAALNELDLAGTVVIGEGERDEAPMLYIGEEVGRGPRDGPAIDIALDPLEGTTITAKAGPNALAVLAIAEKGCLLNAPDVYMDKLACGPGYPDGVLDLDRSASDNVRAIAEAKGVAPDEVIVCVLDRPRHEALIAELRSLGCGIVLIPDGDVAGVMATADPDTTIDLYLGSGRCAGGRAGGGRAALRRRADEGAAALPQRRRAGAGEEVGDHGPGPGVRPEGHGDRRRDLRGDRGHGRLAAGGGEIPARRAHDDGERGDARLVRHRAPSEGGAPGGQAGIAVPPQARLGRGTAPRSGVVEGWWRERVRTRPSLARPAPPPLRHSPVGERHLPIQDGEEEQTPSPSPTHPVTLPPEPQEPAMTDRPHLSSPTAKRSSSTPRAGRASWRSWRPSRWPPSAT